MNNTWDHPDWYDLHDTAWTAGSEREPEHYRELLLALPPLDRSDHLIDIGAGTGKLAALIAGGYPQLGALTLIEPNQSKLDRARALLTAALPHANILGLAIQLGENQRLPEAAAAFVTDGSVLMPAILLRGCKLADGLSWLRRSLKEILAMLRPGGWFYALETLAPPGTTGSLDDPVRRLNMLEFTAEFIQAGFESVECVYRFRDRVTLRGRRSAAE